MRKIPYINCITDMARAAFYVFIELAKNIQRYSAKRKQDDGIGNLMVEQGEDGVTIAAGNAASCADAARLEDILARLKALSRDDLMVLYRTTLKGKTPPHSKGASVGFIDVIRLSGRGIHLSRDHQSEDHCYLLLTAYL